MPIYTFDKDTKSLRLQDLPPEAWTVFGGGSGSPDGAIHKLYQDVAWLNRAVNLRADTVSSVPYRLERNGSAVEDPATLFDWWEDLPDLLDGMEADRTLYGAGYILIERNQFGVVQGLRRLSPRHVKPELDQDKGLTGFKRVLGSKTIMLTLDDVIWSWLPNRAEEIGPGTAPARAALIAAGLIRAGDDFAQTYFKNGAINAMLIDVEEGNPNPDETSRLEEWIKRRVVGIKNAWAVNVGRRKLNVHTLGEGTGDLALPELTTKAREDISTALGIPQSMLFSNAANYATARSDKLNFLANTIIPETRKIAAALNKQFFKAAGLRFEFVPEDLEEFQALEAEKAGAVVQLFNAQIITREEARETMNYTEPYSADPEGGPVLDLPDALSRTINSSTDTLRALAQWQRKAERRVTEGKPAKALEFESDAIDDTLNAAIAGALETVTTAQDVAPVFASVMTWEQYP